MNAAVKTYTLQVTEEVLNILERGLNELPRKLSQPVHQFLLEQIMKQNAAREAEAAKQQVAAKAADAIAEQLEANKANGAANENAEPAHA